MTFDEYNTDENFKGKSTADELVKIGYDEGKTREDIENSLSPLWKEDKKGNVKKALDKYYKVETPKEEPKAEEVKETVTEETAPKVEPLKEATSNLDVETKDFADKNNAISFNAEDEEYKRQEEELGKRWSARQKNIDKMAESMRSINDRMVEQIPTFATKRFIDGEFGDPKSTDAKLRLAHFLVNGVASKLRQASNIAMRTAGKAPMFDDTTSDYEKYQQSNFAKGMENRWRKYEAETQNAIDLVTKETGNEQAARLEAEKLTNDEKMGTKFRMMSAREKADLINIKMEIGKLVGKMDLSEIADFMTGEAISGDLTKDEAIAIGVAQLVKNSPGLLKQLPEGKYKNAVIGLFGGGDVDSIISSLGGDGGDKEEGAENGGTPKTGLTMNDEEFEALRKRSNELSAKYYNGEMSKEDFITEWDKLYKEMNKHPIYKQRNNVRILSTKEILAANKELELKDKFGEDTKSKTFKEGKKAVDYFNDKSKLFDYFKNTEEPNFIDAKAATKNKDYKMKEYQEALKQYEILKKADATNLVGKY